METKSQINTKRIAKNTLFLYVRMMLLMVISLYTSRVVLEKLGVDDYGIYNVVGGIVTMLGFLSSSMSNAVQRYLSFEIGHNGSVKVNDIFNVAQIAHFIIAIFVFVALEVGGLWYIDKYLNVPIVRIDAAIWVLQCSIICTIFSIIQVPYTSVMIAREEMGIYAYISIVDAILKLLVAYILMVTTFDKLKSYAVLMMVSQMLILLIMRLYCKKKYSETRFKRVKDISLLKELMGFAGWNAFGEIAWILTGQGVNMILNCFFGPVVNAARAVAEQVNGAVLRFVSNFQTAINPQIVKSYAANEWGETMKLVYRGTKMSYFLLFILSLPLILEMERILNIWLVVVPKYTTVFCQLILINSIVMSISNLLAQIARAYGKIRNYQLIVSFFLALNFPLSYFLLKFGASPVSTVIVNICIQISLIFVRLLLIKKMITFNFLDYINNVFKPIFFATVVAVIIPFLLKRYLYDTFISSIIVIVASILCSLCASYFIGMNKKEKLFVKGVFVKFLGKLKL